MQISELSFIYDNPLPQLRSRQSAFPFLCACGDGTLLAAHSIGEAFESVDAASHLSRSSDGGRTWSVPKRMFLPRMPLFAGKTENLSLKRVRPA